MFAVEFLNLSNNFKLNLIEKKLDSPESVT
jgi:hypothetical protein